MKERMRDKRRSGFTLIELLLVLVILAVLATILTPKFTNRSKQAKVTAANADISILELSLDAFEIDMGRYPTTAEGISVLLTPPTTNRGEWMGPYLKRGMPVDPWGHAYIYKYPGQHNAYGYDLYSLGPNGQEGGGDDIVNWTTTSTTQL